jgi:hypothetical protein
MLTVNLDTYPEFKWAKGALFAIPQMVRDVNELTRQATQIAKGQSRPRSTGRCRIPGNAQIELMDMLTTGDGQTWLVISIAHQIDLQRKTWSTELGIELFRPSLDIPTSVDMMPLTGLG